MAVRPRRPIDNRIHIQITDRNLNRVGRPITCWESIDCTLRFNAVGSGVFVAPGHHWIREQIEAGTRVVVVREGEIFGSGPIEDAFHERSDDGENAGVGKYTVQFGDDLAAIAERLTYPDPSKTPADQVVDAYEFAGNGEVALRNLVNLNAGPGARPERQVPRLALGTLAGVGTNVKVSTAWEPLTDVLRSVAVDAGGLGFRTRQVGKQLLFQVYQPVDRSKTVRFGFGLGNLRYLGYQRSAPTATTALVGGQGEGADSFVLSRTNSEQEAAWGRREVLVSRPGNNPIDELERDGDEALAEAGETSRLQASAYDSPHQRYGEHFGLGDRVSIQIYPGHEVSDLVRVVHLQAWATAGELVAVTVGSQEALHGSKRAQQLRQIDRRVGRLERTVMPAR